MRRLFAACVSAAACRLRRSGGADPAGTVVTAQIANTADDFAIAAVALKPR